MINYLNISFNIKDKRSKFNLNITSVKLITCPLLEKSYHFFMLITYDILSSALSFKVLVILVGGSNCKKGSCIIDYLLCENLTLLRTFRQTY